MTGDHGHGSAGCREIFARLSEYLDEELPPEPCAEMESHLDHCPPCRDFLESLRRTVRLVERVEAPPLPEEVRRRVREAYHKLRSERGK